LYDRHTALISLPAFLSPALPLWWEATTSLIIPKPNYIHLHKVTLSLPQPAKRINKFFLFSRRWEKEYDGQPSKSSSGYCLVTAPCVALLPVCLNFRVSSHFLAFYFPALGETN